MSAADTRSSAPTPVEAFAARLFVDRRRAGRESDSLQVFHALRSLDVISRANKPQTSYEAPTDRPLKTGMRLDQGINAHSNILLTIGAATLLMK